MKLRIIIIVLAVSALILSIGTEIRMVMLKKQFQSDINRLSASINTRVANIENNMEKVDTYFKPNGMVEKYIIANSFLKKQMDDLEYIITSMQQSDKSGYIQIYITGSKDIWCYFKNSAGNYVFQSNLQPGLNVYKFFFFKQAEIQTKYTIDVPYDASFNAGDPSKVFFLINEPGQTRLKAYPQTGIANLYKDLNLYIPTVTGK